MPSAACPPPTCCGSRRRSRRDRSIRSRRADRRATRASAAIERAGRQRRSRRCPAWAPKAHVDGRAVVVGNHAAVRRRAASCMPARMPTADRLARGRAVAWCSSRVDGMLLGAIARRRRPRETAREAIELLRAHGVRRIAMLTGDHDATAAAQSREAARRRRVPRGAAAGAETGDRGVAAARSRRGGDGGRRRQRRAGARCRGRRHRDGRRRHPTPRSRPPTSR